MRRRLGVGAGGGLGGSVGHGRRVRLIFCFSVLAPSILFFLFPPLSFPFFTSPSAEAVCVCFPAGGCPLVVLALQCRPCVGGSPLICGVRSRFGFPAGFSFCLLRLLALTLAAVGAAGAGFGSLLIVSAGSAAG